MKFGVSSTQCGMLCSSSYHCRSFNICNRRICELNQHDVFSIGVKNQHLVIKKKGCNYHGMRRDFAPICDPNSADLSSDLCGTGGKPVDRIWFFDESVKTNVIADEVMSYQTGEVSVDFAHGGDLGTGPTKVLERLQIVKDYKFWEDAKNSCAKKGGILFSNLDGTSEQLELLVKAQGNVSFWLGLTVNPSNRSVYSRVGGGSIPDANIQWANNQPSKCPDEDYLMVTSEEKKVADASREDKYYSFCDMPL